MGILVVIYGILGLICWWASLEPDYGIFNYRVANYGLYVLSLYFIITASILGIVWYDNLPDNRQQQEEQYEINTLKIDTLELNNLIINK